MTVRSLRGACVALAAVALLGLSACTTAQAPMQCKEKGPCCAKMEKSGEECCCKGKHAMCMPKD